MRADFAETRPRLVVRRTGQVCALAFVVASLACAPDQTGIAVTGIGGSGATGSGGAGAGGGSGTGGGGSGGDGAGAGGSSTAVDAGRGGAGMDAAAGSGGGGSTGADAAAGAGGAPAGGAGGWGIGGGSRCAGSAFAVCEDFESTAAGALPGGDWSAPGTNYGSGSTIVVAADQAARGAHALKVTIPTSATSAERYLQRRNLGTLAAAHYGRLFFRVQSPTTTPFVHWDMIIGAGAFNGTNHRIRWGIVGTGFADWRWIYNVEQGDYGNTSSMKAFHPVVDSWMCVEWLWDGTNQQARFFFDGTEVPDIRVDVNVSGGKPAGMPNVFNTLGFGLAKYQSTDNPLVFWLDEIALDSARIGCDR